MSFVAQNLDKQKFDTTLIIIGLEKESKFNVTSCPVIFLNKTRVLNGAFALYKLIATHKPHVVVSSILHLNVMVGLISVLFSDTIFVGRQTGIKLF